MHDLLRRNQMAIDTVATRGELSGADLSRLGASFESSPAHRIAQNALARTGLREVALNRQAVTSVDHTFSHVLDRWTPVNQKETGRCWIFAALNLFRGGAMAKMNLREFEFSQSHVMFWDKLERANYLLQTIADTASELDEDDRALSYLYENPMQDAGQWDMLVNLVKTHGLVPKAFMPETESSSNSRQMNGILNYWIRYGGQQLRDLVRKGSSQDEIEAAKSGILDVIYRVLRMHLGDPPETIQWQWTDKKGKFHRDPEMTPVEFARKYVDLPLDEYVCLVNDPRNEYGRTYTVQYLGNMVGGNPVVYLNVEIELMRAISRDTIVGGEPVWFGCDASKMSRSDLGILDHGVFDYQTLYGAEFSLSKAQRLLQRESQMTHAMLLTGVDVLDGHARRWRVEDSYGPERGQSGFHVMTNSWFDEYVYEIAARKEVLPDDLRAALDRHPVVLPVWDPMGALAR
jgi:bleomycin hydrolase